MLFKLLPSWVRYVPLIAVTVFCGYLYLSNSFLKEEVINLNKDVAVEQRKSASLLFQVEDMARIASEQQNRLQNLSRDARVAREENNRLNQILEGYKKREETIIKKPSLVERRANAATIDLLRKYECSTGNTNSCSE